MGASDAVRRYHAAVLDALDVETRRTAPVASRARVVRFVSTSDGGGPGSRRARDVALLVVDGNAWDLNARRHRAATKPRLDVVLDELTEGVDVPANVGALDWVVDELDRWGNS